jgi:hypothetical protein
MTATPVAVAALTLVAWVPRYNTPRLASKLTRALRTRTS